MAKDKVKVPVGSTELEVDELIDYLVKFEASLPNRGNAISIEKKAYDLNIDINDLGSILAKTVSVLRYVRAEELKKK